MIGLIVTIMIIRGVIGVKTIIDSERDHFAEKLKRSLNMGD